MKRKLITFMYLSLFSVGLSFAQGSTTKENKFQFGEAEHFLDGYTMNFQYQNSTAIHMEFKDGKAKYE